MIMFKLKSVLGVICILISSCDRLSGCREDITEKLVSPDTKVTVFQIERNCGATTSVLKSVYLAPSNNLDSKQIIFSADRVDRLQVSWLENRKLEIKYVDARISDFQNFWISRELDNFSYEVRIIERKID